MRIRAVIFDMDGLMFDTEDLVRRAWDFAGGRLGYEHFGDNIFNTLGKGDRDRRIYFADKYGQDFPYDQFKQDYHNFYYEEIEKKGVPVKPGLYRLLEYLYENDIPAAVATSSSRRSAAAKLEETDIEKYFKAVIGGDMVTRTKPDPEIYLKACEALGVDAKIPAIMIPDLVKDMPEIEPFLAAKLGELGDVIAFIENERRRGEE